MDDNEEELVGEMTNHPSPKAFSVVQSREFVIPVETNDDNHTDRQRQQQQPNPFDSYQQTNPFDSYQLASLCPSMDLVIVQSQGGNNTVITTNNNDDESSRDDDENISSLDIYRTMQWQKVTKVLFRSSSSSSSSSSSTQTQKSSQQQQQQINTLFGWSPNGQLIVVARNRTLAVYGLEDLANPSSSSSMVEGNNSGHLSGQESDGTGGDVGSTVPSFSIQLKYPVQGLKWVHVGRNHPTASIASREEMEREMTWRYQSQYVDQSTSFLPPSSYYYSNHNSSSSFANQNLEIHSDRTVSLVQCQTPLSVLCVATSHGFDLYLHGRYHLLTLPYRQDRSSVQSMSASPFNITSKGSSNSKPLVTASNDLSYWLMSEPVSNHAEATKQQQYGGTTVGENRRLVLYKIPLLNRHRYELQQIASLHASIVSHISVLEKSSRIVADNWKTSLKPLDQKVQPLLRLLSNYGVDVELPNGRPSAKLLRNVLKDYILLGHSGHSTAIANAMDQFFTSVQMNDQLLQRMERSLHASLANIESAAISDVLRPSQALGWQIQELIGLVRYFSTLNDESIINIDSAPEAQSKEFHISELIDTSERLWEGAEQLRTEIVKSRLAVRDFCGWLRHASSQVKARGTAMNSVQRENARKRRVSQAALERLVSSLLTNPDGNDDEMISKDFKHAGLAESLLGLRVTHLLRDSEDKESNSTKDIVEANTNRPQSPSSVTTSLIMDIPTLPVSVNRISGNVASVVANPLSNIPQKMPSNEIFLPQTRNHEKALVATHTRVGLDPFDDSIHDVWGQNEQRTEDSERSYFLPKVAKHSYSHIPSKGLEKCRHWFVVAQASESSIQLFALPVGWKPTQTQFDEENDDGDDDTSDGNIAPPFYLTSSLKLPVDGSDSSDVKKIIQLGFYGDDGKSSLSSGDDSGTGKEGRQKLAIVCRPRCQQINDSNIELWTFPYDDMSWQVRPYDSMLVHPSNVEASCCHVVVPEHLSSDEVLESAPNVVLAQARTIVECNDVSSSSHLFLSGSRGIGGVALISQEGSVSMQLLDLEDCEEDEDMEEDE